MKDPFEGVWEVILSSVLAHPDWSGRQFFQELQRLFPGRYQPSQLPTLQQGLRKIRAHLLALMEDPWPPEVLQAPMLSPLAPAPDQLDRAASPPSVCSSEASRSSTQAETHAGASLPLVEEADALPMQAHEPIQHAGEPTDTRAADPASHDDD